MVFYSAAETIVKHGFSASLLPIGKEQTPITYVINGNKHYFEGNHRPIKAWVFWRAVGGPSFNLAFSARNVVLSIPGPGAPDDDILCFFGDTGAKEEDVRNYILASFSSFDQKLPTDSLISLLFEEIFDKNCLSDPRGYFFIVSYDNRVIINTNIEKLTKTIMWPHDLFIDTEKEPFFSFDEKCVHNGLYGTCFNNLDIATLPPISVYLVIFAYVAAYSLGFSVASRLVSKKDLLSSFRTFLLANMTVSTISIVYLVAAFVVARVIGVSYVTTALIGMFALLVFHSYRLFQLVSIPDESVIKRVGATAVGFLCSWTVGAIVFIPLVIVAIYYGQLIKDLV